MSEEKSTNLTESEFRTLVVVGTAGNLASLVLVDTVIPGPVKDQDTKEEILEKASALESQARQAEEFSAKLQGNEDLIAISSNYNDQASALRGPAPNPNIYGTALELVAGFVMFPALTYATLKARAIRRARALKNNKDAS